VTSSTKARRRTILLAAVAATTFLLFAGQNRTAVGDTMSYEIEAAHNDELFIINGEKFEAQTYCLGWEEGDEVIFLEGSPYGACATATLYNKTKRDTCEVWCE
jgi:hypothetical protein